MLFVVDGAKALRKAIRSVFGDVPVQRCIRHKERNVADHLPERDRPPVKRRLRRAWAETDHARALDGLRLLAVELERSHSGAAGSLREGLEETLTLTRLGIRGSLRRTLESTNPCESMIECVRRCSRNVKRWQSGDMALRWTAAGMLEAGASSGGSSATATSRGSRSRSSATSTARPPRPRPSRRPLRSPPPDHHAGTAVASSTTNGTSSSDSCRRRLTQSPVRAMPMTTSWRRATSAGRPKSIAFAAARKTPLRPSLEDQMPDMTRLGQAGLKGWREKVGDRAAPVVAQRTALNEEQVRALIGALFFALSVMYVAKTLAALSRELRGR